MISKTGIFVLLGACIIAGMLIAGCTQPQTTTAVTTTTTTVAPVATSAAESPGAASSAAATSTTVAETTAATAGIANPASVNCGALGGQTEIKTAADGGQYGMCAFTNGTTCEEWALFRGEGCKPYTAPTAAATTAAVANATTEATAAATATVTK